MVWQWLYNEDYGLINAFLGQLGLYQPPWLTSEKWAMPSVIIMSIWKNLGFNAVILLAGVQGISSEIYESADIDGANVVQKFFKITMPLLKPTIVFVTIISMINSFQAFDQIYVMTKGGPGTATQVVSYLIYMNAFQYFKQGYASAMAYILFIIVFIASIVLSDINACGTHSLFNFHADSFPLDDIFIPERCTRVVCHTAILDSKARSVGKLCVYV